MDEPTEPDEVLAANAATGLGFVPDPGLATRSGPGPAAAAAAVAAMQAVGRTLVRRPRSTPTCRAGAARR